MASFLGAPKGRLSSSRARLARYASTWAASICEQRATRAAARSTARAESARPRPTRGTPQRAKVRTMPAPRFAPSSGYPPRNPSPRDAACPLSTRGGDETCPVSTGKGGGGGACHIPDLACHLLLPWRPSPARVRAPVKSPMTCLAGTLTTPPPPRRWSVRVGPPQRSARAVPASPRYRPSAPPRPALPRCGTQVHAALFTLNTFRISPPPPPRTKWIRRVPHPVLIGHAASLTPVLIGHAASQHVSDFKNFLRSPTECCLSATRPAHSPCARPRSRLTVPEVELPFANPKVPPPLGA